MTHLLVQLRDYGFITHLGWQRGLGAGLDRVSRSRWDHRKMEYGAIVDHGICPNTATTSLHNFLNDRQTDSGAIEPFPPVQTLKYAE